jgi:hypothetical protein
MTNDPFEEWCEDYSTIEEWYPQKSFGFQY